MDAPTFLTQKRLFRAVVLNAFRTQREFLKQVVDSFVPATSVEENWVRLAQEFIADLDSSWAREGNWRLHLISDYAWEKTATVVWNAIERCGTAHQAKVVSPSAYHHTDRLVGRLDEILKNERFIRVHWCSLVDRNSTEKDRRIAPANGTRETL